MAKRIAILYFSGTGNTEAVARMLRDELALGAAVDMLRIEDIIRGREEFTPGGYDMFGIGFPSYGFNAPGIVKSFVKNLPAGSVGVFLFMTCAGPCYINDIAGFGLKRLLRRRGYTLIHEKVFCMPANVLIWYRDEIARQLVNAALRRAHSMAADIFEGRVRIRRDGAGAMLVRSLYAWCEGLALPLLALDFHVRETCNQCLKCVNNCPKGNIRLRGGKIRFGARCAGCYRCVYNCPQKAIGGRLYGFAILKQGYDIGRILRDDTIDGNFINDNTKGLFSTLRKYLSES
jgi:flavodoxin/ferredoxin